MPVVSICCLTFNHEKFIRDAIEGFLMQETTFPVEILITDDASTDDNAAIIREYEQAHPQLFKVVCNEVNQYSQGGHPGKSTRDRARGEFIAMCEGDDYWTCKDKLQKQVRILEGDPGVSLVFHDAHVMDADGRLVRMHPDMQQTIFHIGDIMRPWFIPTASMVFRRMAIADLPKWSKDCQSGDIILQLFCALHGCFHFIKEPMSVYRKHFGGISAGITGINTIAMRAYIYESFNIHTNRKYEGQLRKALEMEVWLHTPELRDLGIQKARHWRYHAALIRHKLKVFLGMGKS